MIRVLRYAIFSLVFTFVVLAASANAQGEITEILRRLENHNKALQSVQARVTMVKLNSQLNIPDKYTGSTSYLPKTTAGKMYMRLDWKEPTVEQISVIGDDYELYKPSIKLVYVGKVNKAKGSSSAGNALAFMNMNRDQLRKNYEVTHVGNETLPNGTLTARILLTPKAATSYKTAEMWIDKDGMPVQAKITEKNNDTTTVLLEDIRKNGRLNTKIFELDYPKGTRKQKT